MRIGVAQTKSEAGNLTYNLEKHIKLTERAVDSGIDLLVFPELSLMGYEPELAHQFAMSKDDPLLDEFQIVCDTHHIVLCIGVPLKHHEGVQIGMIISQPHRSRESYAKQFLHEDELPYFVPGTHQIVISVKEHQIAPAICYESLQEKHATHAANMGASIYMTSVAKSASGLKKAINHFPYIAKKYHMPVIMANCVGYCDNFVSAGKSAIWNADGKLVGQLDDQAEGILSYDLINGFTSRQELGDSISQ